MTLKSRDAAAAPALVGQVFDAYRVERLIGEGGMGAVYEASHTRIPKRFAIKVLHGAWAEDDEVVKRFQREAMIGSTLGHENIVEVFDFNQTPAGSPYIVMELLAGEDLGQIAHRERTLPLTRAVSFAHQICSALQAAHDHGVVHRDIKPENVFVTKRSSGGELAKVLDFGISKVADSQSMLTGDAAVLGTPWYMAPEQAQGRTKEIDHRTDLFAVGVILYRMIAGEVPFSGPSVPAVLYQVVHDTPRPVRELRPDAPGPLAEVIERAIAKRAGDRFQSGREMIDALVNAMGVEWKTVLAWSVAPELSGERVASPSWDDFTGPLPDPRLPPSQQLTQPPSIGADAVETLAFGSVEATGPRRPAGGAAVTPRPASRAPGTTTLSGSASQLIGAPKRSAGRWAAVAGGAAVLVGSVVWLLSTSLAPPGGGSAPGASPAVTPAPAGSSAARATPSRDPAPDAGPDDASAATATTPDAARADAPGPRARRRPRRPKRPRHARKPRRPKRPKAPKQPKQAGAGSAGEQPPAKKPKVLGEGTAEF